MSMLANVPPDLDAMKMTATNCGDLWKNSFFLIKTSCPDVLKKRTYMNIRTSLESSSSHRASSKVMQIPSHQHGCFIRDDWMIWGTMTKRKPRKPP